LGWKDYIRIHLVSVLTYLISSLQTSLHFQAKQKANRKQTESKQKGDLILE